MKAVVGSDSLDT